MNIIIKANHIIISKGTQDAIEKKFNGLKKFIKDKNTEARLEIEVGKTTKHHRKGEIFKANVNFNNAGEHYRVSAEGTDLHIAIDKAREEILQELTTHKDKKVSLVRRGRKSIKNVLKGIEE